MKLFRASIFVACLIVAAVAVAAAVSFTWEPPVQRTDGTALEPGELVTYELECVDTADSANTVTEQFPAEDALNNYVADLPLGIWDCRLRVSNAAGFSDWSNIATKNVEPTAPPEPPTNFL